MCGSPGRTGSGNIYTLNSVEQKFQHFLNSTVRAGSIWGGTGGRSGTWTWDSDHWIVRRQPNILFGCVGLVTSFLAYWFNYNEEYFEGWSNSILYGIHQVFNEELNSHDVFLHDNRRHRDIPCIDIRGYREFIHDPVERNFYFDNYIVSIIGNVADFINNGMLLLTRISDGNYFFKWNPINFQNFNVMCLGSHHVYLYIKRGNGGENDPPTEDNTPHQLWRLAADYPIGSPTTWREEEIRIRICPGDHAIHTRHRGTRVQNVNVYPDSQITQASAEYLHNRYVTNPNEIPTPEKRWKEACNSIIAIWKLSDLRDNAQAPIVSEDPHLTPFLENTSRRIEIISGPSSTRAIPNLTSFQIMKEIDEEWQIIEYGGEVNSGNIIKFIIESTGLIASTQLNIELVGIHSLHYRNSFPEIFDVIQEEVTGNRIEIEYQLLNISAPFVPENIYFIAWIYEFEFNIQSPVLNYLA
jgi:hypothetical protein